MPAIEPQACLGTGGRAHLRPVPCPEPRPGAASRREDPWSVGFRESIAVGGPAWRRARGLATWKDEARRWRGLRYIAPGCLCPLPEDLLPTWRGACHG